MEVGCWDPHDVTRLATATDVSVHCWDLRSMRYFSLYQWQSHLAAFYGEFHDSYSCYYSSCVHMINVIELPTLKCVGLRVLDIGVSYSVRLLDNLNVLKVRCTLS